MSSELKLRRGSTVAHSTFTGADGEVTFNTDTNALITHDGATPGGFSTSYPDGASKVGFKRSDVAVAAIGDGRDDLRNAKITRTIYDKLLEEIYVEDFGAVGDGITDDTVALQAAIDYAVLNTKRLNLLAKTYLISAPLTVGTTALQSGGGFAISGVGVMNIENRGTRIKLQGTGHECIINFREGAFRHFTFENITLACAIAPAADVYAATHGIFFSQTAFSGGNFTNIGVSNVRHAIYIQAGGYANGEFLNFTGVSGLAVQKFFMMAVGTGQSYGHKFINCGSLMFESTGSSEYVHFDIANGDGNGGYDTSVLNYNSTIVRLGTDLSRNTLVKLGYCATFYLKGGRHEGLTTILESTSATANVSITDCDFAGVFSTNTNPTVIGHALSNAGSVVISDCNIPIVAGYKFHFKSSISNTTAYLFLRCNIVVYGPYDYLDSLITVGNGAAVTFSDCLLTSTRNRYYQQTLNRSFNSINTTELVTKYNQVTSATPENLLLYSDFGAAAPTAPWVSSFVFPVYQRRIDKISGGYNNIYVYFPHGGSVYQDIPAAANTILYYNAMMNVGATDEAPLKISLTDIATGKLLDSVHVSAGSHAISLSGWTLSASGVRLKLEVPLPAAAPSHVGLAIGFQQVTRKGHSGFVPTTSAVRTFAHNWGSVDSFRAFGRLSLPYTPRTAVALEALYDVESDIAVSSLSNRLIYYANGRGNELQNQDVGTAAPTALTFPAGWLRYNTAPAPAGFIGWVCTTAGTMGTLNGGATTGSIAISTQALTVNSITGLLVGQLITVAGVSGVKKVTGLVPTTTTGSITSGTTSIVVAVTTNYVVGTQLTIAGVTGTKTVTAIVGNTITIDSAADATVASAVVAGTPLTITIDSVASATVTGAAVAFSTGVWKTFGAISA